MRVSTSSRCTSAFTSTIRSTLEKSSNCPTKQTVAYVLLPPSPHTPDSFRPPQAQAFLLLSQTASLTPFSLSALSALLEEIVGFFLIESHVLKTTNSFRSEQDVEDLWDGMCERVVRIVDEGLGGCEDPEAFLGTKFKVLTFVQTLEVGFPLWRRSLWGLMVWCFVWAGIRLLGQSAQQPPPDAL